MEKLGRNDPCHCGSGKKYKKCCLEQDERNNIARIVPTAADPVHHSAILDDDDDDDDDDESYMNDAAIGPADVEEMIEEKLPWANVLYQMLARHLTLRMAGRHDWGLIAQAVVVLHAYSAYEQPMTKKPGVLPAAVEYCVAALINGYNVTQAELAELYDVSVTTVSKKSQEILDFVERHMDQFAQALEQDEDLPSKTRAANGRESMGVESAMRKFSGSIQDVESGIAGERHPQRQQAVDLTYQAWQEQSRKKRAELARQALSLYPDCADAYNILAETESQSLEHIAEHYRRGALAGEKDLGQAYIEDNRGYFWGLIETRPYMRAKAGYAEACLYMGKTQEAIKQLEELLELNPNDNQGMRDFLSIAYLQKKRYRDAQQLIDRYGENSTAVQYDRLLIEYGLNGITDKLSKLYREARRSNPHIPPYLLGKKQTPDYPPDYVSPGDDSEAADYAVTRYEVWSREKRLLNWLATAAR